MKKLTGIIAVILSMTMLASCSSPLSKDSEKSDIPTPDPKLVKNTIEATIELESGDSISLELYPDLAPETVENFVELAEDGFYDGTIFHRVIENFMIQGGGYDENLKQQKASTIKGEFAENDFENTLAHARGVISMARAQDPDSASSQFFIVHQDSTYLDGKYAAFGKVTEGMEIVDDIATVSTGAVAASGMEDVPVKPIIIETITIGSGSSKSDKSESKNKTSKNKEEQEDTEKEEESTKEDNVSKKASKSTTAPKSSNDDEEKDTSSEDEISIDDLTDLPFISTLGASDDV